MTVYVKPQSKYYHYDFQHGGRRYHGSTATADLEKARAFEAALKSQVKGGAPDIVCQPRSKRLVYIVEGVSTRMVKIGSAINVAGRLANLQCGSPDKLNLLWSGSGGVNAETMAHREMASSRAHGEWFRPTTAILRLIDVARATDDIYAAILEAVKWRDAA